MSEPSTTLPPPRTPPSEHAGSFGELARHFLLNLSASAWGLVLALVTTPILVHRLGPSVYGVYALLGVLLSHLQFAQLGLARAVERESAVALGADRESRARRHFETALTLQCAIAILLVVLLASVGPPVLKLFRISSELDAAASFAFRLFALNVGMNFVAGIGQAFLRAHRDFLSLNRISIATQTVLSALVVTVALVRPSLVGVVGAVVIASTLRLTLVFLVTLRLLGWRLSPSIDRSSLRELLGLGLPLTVNSLVAPVLTNLEKILSAALIGAEALTYYIVPFRVLSRFSVVAGSLNRALFPLFSRQEGEADYHAMRRVNMRATTALAWFLLPAFAGLRVAGDPLLALWMGADFAAKAAPLLPLLLLGTWINLLAWNTVAVIQARGRPLLLTWLYLAELALYVPVSLQAMKLLGLLGVAVAWLFRVALDAVLLWILSKVLFRRQKVEMRLERRHLLLGFLLLALGEVAHAGLDHLAMLLGTAFLLGAAWSGLAWSAALNASQRRALRGALMSALPPRASVPSA